MYPTDDGEEFLGEDTEFAVGTSECEFDVKSVFLELHSCSEVGRFVHSVKYNLKKKTIAVKIAEDTYGQVALMLSRLIVEQDDLTIAVRTHADDISKGHKKVFSGLVLLKHKTSLLSRAWQNNGQELIGHKLKFSWKTYEVILPKSFKKARHK